MKAAFYTLGCKVNQYETQIMEQKLAGNGYEIVNHDEKADIYIVNSCTVTAESDRKTRQILRRFRKINPEAMVVLSGCFPQSFREQAESMTEADVITGTRERSQIDKIIGEALQTGCRIVRISDFEKNEKFEKMKAEGFIGHTRAFVKIEDGCSRYCSYCIIPSSRGPVRSKLPQDIREELIELSKSNYREIVLVGINLSSYGRDLDGINLADALNAAEDAAETQQAAMKDSSPSGIRIRLGSLEPDIITDEFIERIKQIKHLCPHFHLSMQSGCDATLKRMNRHYTTEEYAAAVEKLRKAFLDCAITTDVIVGFPGETDEEFTKSLNFVKNIGFAQAHVFAYSRRSGTRAAEMPDQIEKHVKEQRSRAMIAATRESLFEFLKVMIGKHQQVLFETAVNEKTYEGFTPNYATVRTESEIDLQGKMAEVLINGVEDDTCTGLFIKFL